MGTHWKKLSNPNYLGSWDFQPSEERVLTIGKISQDEVTDMEAIKKDAEAKKLCIVAHFREGSKPMIMNKTNCKMMQFIYGTPIVEEWAEKSVVVKVEKVRAFGKLEEALRIKDITRCEQCKNKVGAVTGYTAQQVAITNQKRYGVVLCADCSGKRKEVKADEN